MVSDQKNGESDSTFYRKVLGHLPTGVCVLTGVCEKEYFGVTLGSVCSVSLEPQKLLFCIGEYSSVWKSLQHASSFCINILAYDQENVSNLFAGSMDNKFDRIEWEPSHNGAPKILGSLATIDISLDVQIPAGDHQIVLCDVDRLELLREEKPLVFCQGKYFSVDD